MKRYDVIVIGAGPAGLSAAIVAASKGMSTLVFDENDRPGGQLFKQIHKFFGSKEHKAKIRGFKIGQMLLAEAQQLGVQVELNATVIGLFPNKEISVMQNDTILHYRANSIVIATGASENMIPFPGWTLPGVMGAGAAQTMMNIHGIKPGQNILMVGSGNVGVVVGYQLLQAGCQLAGVIDAAPVIGGYGVHAAKIARMGVPFYLSHTIVGAYGTEKVEKAVIAKVDKNWSVLPGTEQELAVDTVCLAVGLTPSVQLAKMAGCLVEDVSCKGGLVPATNEYGETSVSGIYVAGDVAGIEEASSAMIQGKIAGIAIARAQGYLQESEFTATFEQLGHSLSQLRAGQFCHENKGRTDLAATDEGYSLSHSLMVNGYLLEQELAMFPGASISTDANGVFPVVECTQNIPCDPCQDVCKKGCIQVGQRITNLPVVNQASSCNGCGMCVASCPGQAIFLVDRGHDAHLAAISIPYEEYPLPQPGHKGKALDRGGQVVGEAQVVKVKTAKAMDQTAIVTIQVPQSLAMTVRYFIPWTEEGVC